MQGSLNDLTFYLNMTKCCVNDTCRRLNEPICYWMNWNILWTSENIYWTIKMFIECVEISIERKKYRLNELKCLLNDLKCLLNEKNTVWMGVNFYWMGWVDYRLLIIKGEFIYLGEIGVDARKKWLQKLQCILFL